MWMALLLLSWGLEGVVGIWFCIHYWMITRVPYHGGAAIIGPGYALVQVYNAFMSNWKAAYHLHQHPFVLTQSRLALFFIIVYAALHILALARGLSAPHRTRRRLGVRRRPSGREIQRFEQVYDGLLRAQAATLHAPPIRRPRTWRVYDDDQGMQMRFIGFVLVIDRGLLYSRYFPALLAHELAHVDSFDLIARGLYAPFPPFRWSVFTLVGLPLACGPLILHLAWMKYWRERVFAADEYAAKLGQGHALKRALDELRWVLDGGRATRGGRWLREAPYLEERIDRLDRYQVSPAGTSSAADV